LIKENNMKKITTLFTLGIFCMVFNSAIAHEVNIVKNDTGIVINKWNLYNLSDSKRLFIEFKNTSDKTIKSYKLKYSCVNDFGDNWHAGMSDYDTVTDLQANIKPGKTSIVETAFFDKFEVNYHQVSEENYKCNITETKVIYE